MPERKSKFKKLTLKTHMNNFLKGKLKILKYAIKGFFLLIKTEHNIIAQSIIFLGVIMLGIVLNISKQDWINQTFVMGLVLSVEGLNTAVKKMADFVHKEYHTKISFIKIFLLVR